MQVLLVFLTQTKLPWMPVDWAMAERRNPVTTFVLKWESSQGWQKGLFRMLFCNVNRKGLH